MSFNRKFSKYISVVLASSAFCSNSLIGAITDEEFEKYRRIINVCLPKQSIPKDVGLSIKDNKLIFDPTKELSNKEKGLIYGNESIYRMIFNNKATSKVTSNVKMNEVVPIYNIVFNTKINTEIGNDKVDDKFDYKKIESIDSDYLCANMELFVRFLICRIIYNIKLSGNVRYISDLDHYDKKEQSVNFKNVVYSFFDFFKLLGLLDQNCSEPLNFFISANDFMSKNLLFKCSLDEFFKDFTKNFMIRKYTNISELKKQQEIILRRYFFSFKYMLLGNLLSGGDLDAYTLSECIDDKLSRSVDKLSWFQYNGRYDYYDLKEIIYKNLYNGYFDEVIKNVFEYVPYGRVPITCEKVKEVYAKAHESLKHNHNQEKCELLGCKKILENPMLYYFENHKVIDSLLENIFNFVNAIVECC